MPERRISAEAYQALHDALPAIVWYKRTFRQYLKVALRQHPELLSNLDFDQTKREVADEIVDRLINDERSYQDVTLRLMLEIANTTSFPELERHEDSATLVAKATEAVTRLRGLTAAHEQLVIEREREDAARAAYAQQAELQRRFSDELAELKDDFLQMHAASDAQRRGRDFEKFLNRLFALFDLEPRLSYVIDRQQIDGAFSFDTDDYVLEAKWTRERVDVAQANHFAAKVRSKGKNALGLIVSVSGFTEDAIAEYSRSTVFMTMDGADLMCALDQRARLDDVLRRKKRHANETGECYFPVATMFE